MSLPSKCQELHRCDYAKLAEWSLLTLEIHKLPTDLFNQLKNLGEQAVYDRFDHPDSVTNITGKVPWVKTQWHNNENKKEEKKEEFILTFEIQEFKKDEEPTKLKIKSLHTCLPETLFEEDFRGYEATQNSYKPGKGKGLFIVKSICDLYNIGIYYDSESVANTPENSELGCWHIFTLSFPPKLLQ